MTASETMRVTSFLIVCLAGTLLFGCDGGASLLAPAPGTQPIRGQAVLQAAAPRPDIHLEQATLAVNGEVLMEERLNLSDEGFGFFFLYLKEGDLFIIGTQPVHIASGVGQFRQNELHVEVNGFTLSLTTQASHFFSDGVDRDAYTVHLSDYALFAPGVPPADAVVGLVDVFGQIPGWDGRRANARTPRRDPR